MDTEALWNAMGGTTKGIVSFMGNAIVIVLVILGAGGYFLWRGIENKSMVAAAIAGALGVMVIGVFFWTLLLGALWLAHTMQARQAEQERQRDLDNTKENLAIMALTAKAQGAQTQVQNAQTAGLLRQVREYQRQLPAPGEQENIDALVFDDAVFDELEG
jgi:membrane protein implicated in regulation of membrane protease activity